MMNHQQLREQIFSRKPKYSAKFRPLVEKLSTIGDATGKGDFTTFGAIYQTFMYAYIIGLRLGKKTPFQQKETKTEFAPISYWKPAPVRDFIIITLLNRVDKFDDYKWDWLSLENASEENVNNFVTMLVHEMESYANTGFEYLQKKWDEEKSTTFTQPTVFVDILEELPSADTSIE